MKFIPLLHILVLYNATKFCNLSLKNKETTENRMRKRRGGGNNSQPGTKKRKKVKVQNKKE